MRESTSRCSKAFTAIILASDEKGTLNVKTCFNTITAGLDRRLEDIIEACGKARFDGMELDLRAIDEAAGRVSLADIRRMLSDRGLAPVSVMAFDLAPFAEDDAAYERFRRGADAAKALGAPILLTYCAARAPASMSREAALDAAGKRARLYAEAAGPVRVALEPIGGTELMGGPTPALEIARRSGAANVGIMMDTFHYYKSAVPDADILAIPRDKLLIVHVNDSEDLPPAELKDSHRLHVGKGILPLDRDLSLIRSIGYDGFLSVEIFREDYWREPVGKVVADAKAALDGWLAKGH
jgi:2-keto-myo-inositol isomerase